MRMWPAFTKEQHDVTHSALCMRVKSDMEATAVSVYGFIFKLLCSWSKWRPNEESENVNWNDGSLWKNGCCFCAEECVDAESEVCMSVQTEVALQTNTCIWFTTTCKSGPNLIWWSDSVGFVLFTLPLNNQIWVTWSGGIRFGPLGPAVWMQP